MTLLLTGNFFLAVGLRRTQKLLKGEEEPKILRHSGSLIVDTVSFLGNAIPWAAIFRALANVS